MGVNKVVYVENGVEKTLVDLTADTVTADKLASGITAHDKTGTQITGTMETSSVKLQSSKSVTVTQNGTVSVNPDSGYDGLKKADITVNVPSSGGADLKAMIISFEVLTTGEDNFVELRYVNKNGEYTDDFFDDFSSSNIIEIEVADPSFIIISTPSSCQYDNIEYDVFGNNGTYADTDYGGGGTHLLIILTQHLLDVWKTSRVVLSLD